MNITLLAKKGGVGKNTLSILLYEAFSTGRKVRHDSGLGRSRNKQQVSGVDPRRGGSGALTKCYIGEIPKVDHVLLERNRAARARIWGEFLCANWNELE